MSVIASKSAPNPIEGTEATARHSMRVTLLLSVTIFAVAVAYFAGLYLITH
jgi:hypothetical protein